MYKCAKYKTSVLLSNVCQGRLSTDHDDNDTRRIIHEYIVFLAFIPNELIKINVLLTYGLGHLDKKYVHY